MSAASDVLVVGGGVVGTAVAYYAAKAGLSVTLVDNTLRGCATSASAGGLWPLGESLGLGCGVIYYRYRKARGEACEGPEAMPPEFLEFSMSSNAMHPGLAEELRRIAGLDVEFERTGLLFLMYDDGDEGFARSLVDRRPCDPKLLEWLSPEELAKREPAVTRNVRGALCFHGDDQVNPYKLAEALRIGARALGAKVVTHTQVTGLHLRDGRVQGVETAAGFMAAGTVVNAAGAWAGELVRGAGLDLPVRPVRGQIVCTETLPKLLNACLSTSECYLAQKGHGEIIVGSTTEDAAFDAAVTPQAMCSLAAGAVHAMPFFANVRVKRVWAGLRPGTPDELPILGPVDGLAGYLNACGHFRTGILNAPLTGLMLAELLTGQQLSFPVEPFLLSRFQDARSRPRRDERPAVKPWRERASPGRTRTTRSPS